MSEGLDPVDKNALKGKHKDRKDKDLDNDGDVDSSDQYLHKRRKAISKAVTKEEVELDEVSNSVKDQLGNIDLSIRDWEKRWKNKSTNNPNDMKAPQKIKDLKAQKAALMKKHNIKEEVETVEEGESGLWANIKKKRDRIKKGSGEKMRKPGSDGAPTDQDFKDAAESVEEGTITCPKCNGKGCEHCDGKGTHTEDQQIDEFVGKAIGGAVKMIAKGARNAVVDKKGNVRGTKAARADSAEAKANKAEKKVKDAKRIKDAQARLATARKKAQEK